MNVSAKPTAIDDNLVEAWLSKFERALAAQDRSALEAAFVNNCHCCSAWSARQVMLCRVK